MKQGEAAMLREEKEEEDEDGEEKSEVAGEEDL